MKVSELGESKLIERISGIVDRTRDNSVPSWRDLVLGIGDDAAAWRCGGSIQLASVDSLRQGVHFELETTGWRDLGWKALAVNLSDIAAMGAAPRYALVSLSFPENTEAEDVEFFYKGLTGLAEKTGVAVIGGDLDGSPIVEVTVTIIGSAPAGSSLLRRSAAKPGDKIAVTGSLGAAAGGLKMLTNHLHFDDTAASTLRAAFLRPVPRLDEGLKLVECGVKAAMDISDGLFSDLGHICHASGAGARLEAASIPISSAIKDNFGKDAFELAVSGGEDYELLFTADDEKIERVRSSVSCPITIIGEIITDPRHEVIIVGENGKPVDIAVRGWEHFKSI